MKFAIISAGEGSRLAQEGVQLPKPLVQLNGMAMIDRLIHIFAKNGAEEVVVIINNEVALTKEHLSKLEKTSEVPLRVIVKTTPSSMHSFYELSRYLIGQLRRLLKIGRQGYIFSNVIHSICIPLRQRLCYPIDADGGETVAWFGSQYKDRIP